MKHLILAVAAAAALTLTTANAQDCKGLGDLAEKVMEVRQAGVPLSDIMSSADFSELTKRMAVEAYKSPRFQTDTYQRKAAQDFRANWELACYQSASKKGGSV